MATIKKITPHLWFDSQAEEAAKYYTSIFKDSGIDKIMYYPKAGQDIHGRAPGSVMTVEFNLSGQKFIALNAGPLFKFNESVSFLVSCENQQEIDYYWDKLSQGGDPKAQQCGWLKDKFGLSWQVVPTALSGLMNDTDQEKVQHVFEAFLKMKKVNIEQLENAASEAV